MKGRMNDYGGVRVVCLIREGCDVVGGLISDEAMAAIDAIEVLPFYSRGFW